MTEYTGFYLGSHLEILNPNISLPSPRESRTRGVKLTVQLHLVPRSRMVDLYFHTPIGLHGVMLH
jgi:hypothetical protein